VLLGDGPCGRGCAIKANYQSTTVHLPPPWLRANLDIVTDAMVRAVITDGHGKATGVQYVDKERPVRICRPKARVVVLAASGCESALILLNSKSGPLRTSGQQQRQGRRYLMDTVGSSLTGQIPALEIVPA